MLMPAGLGEQRAEATVQMYCMAYWSDAITTYRPAASREGQNWSVELRAFDGLDEGYRASRGRSSSTRLADQDTLQSESKRTRSTTSGSTCRGASRTSMGTPSRIWSIPLHIISGDHRPSRKVTLRPEADWNGQESATFIASDGS